MELLSCFNVFFSLLRNYVLRRPGLTNNINVSVVIINPAKQVYGPLSAGDTPVVTRLLLHKQIVN